MLDYDQLKLTSITSFISKHIGWVSICMSNIKILDANI